MQFTCCTQNVIKSYLFHHHVFSVAICHSSTCKLVSTPETRVGLPGKIDDVIARWKENVASPYPQGLYIFPACFQFEMSEIIGWNNERKLNDWKYESYCKRELNWKEIFDKAGFSFDGISVSARSEDPTTCQNTNNAVRLFQPSKTNKSINIGYKRLHFYHTHFHWCKALLW